MSEPLDEAWRKARRCDTSACVEVRAVGGVVQVRDSKTGSVLSFSPDEWATFIAEVEAGEFRFA